MDIEVSANPRPSFWKSGFSKFSAALCFFISVGSVAMVAAADDGVCHVGERSVLSYGGRANACGVRESGHREGTLYA